MKQKLRKNCDTLASLGIGVCLLGIWSVAKSTMYYILNFSELTNFLMDQDDDPILYYIIAVMTMIAFLAVHLYIGLAARAVGTRGKNHIVYAFLSILLAVIYIISIPEELDISEQPGQTIADAVASMITDATTAIILLHTAFTSFKIQLLKKQSKKQEAA